MKPCVLFEVWQGRQILQKPGNHQHEPEKGPFSLLTANHVPTANDD